MKKKYFVTDDDDNVYQVEEVEACDEGEETEEVAPDENMHDEDVIALTDEEISALKQLAAIAPQLIAMANPSTNDADEEEELTEDDENCPECEDEDEPIEDEDFDETVTDEDEDEESDEKVVDTCKKDSITFNKLEKQKKTNDSIGDDMDVEAAWAKRFNGGK